LDGSLIFETLGSFCSGNGDLLQNLMTKDTIRGNLTQFLPDIQATHAQGLEYIFGYGHDLHFLRVVADVYIAIVKRTATVATERLVLSLSPSSFRTLLILDFVLAGVSNVAGAALWALDYGLQIATLSVPQAYFHEGIGFKYNFVRSSVLPARERLLI
jgi:xanthine/CO dehydrogenase XdhC/CoxF family maturation factor